MKILVVGGAGYVGSHCVRRLVAAGHDVTVYDNLSAGHAKAIPDGTPLIRAEMADLVTLDGVLADGFDGVMHFAAHLDVGESVRQPLKYYENNVVNTIHLLKLMERRGIRRFVFSSTCATYGEPDSMPIVEDMPQAPINPYGHTKLVMEWALRDSAVAWNLGACALRYFNACGAAFDGSIGEDHDPEIHLIPIVLQVALGQREKVSIFGTDYPTLDGTCIRDYVHVEDLAEAHLLAMESIEEGRFEAYNLGTGIGTSVREIIDAARRVTGHEIPTTESERRPGDPPRLYADPSKIKSGLGWEPKYTNITGTIETAWKWHMSHPNGYED